MRSSYIQNNYGEVFEAIIQAHRPRLSVELGILDGYSTLHIAKGLKYVNEGGRLEAYDLFERYKYKHSKLKDVEKMFEEEMCGILNGNIKLACEDAFEVHEKYYPGSVDLLHVDLSNTGETIRKIMLQWDSKLSYGSLILFEGGTEERDQVEWMLKYKKEPIKPEMESNPIIKKKYVFGTYLKFPGLTVMIKKR